MSEVEKLRKLLAEARDALSKGCWGGKCCELRHRIDAALAEPVGNDFKRGAEAMREAAAQLFDGIPNVPSLASMPLYAEVIRALPIPKDKP